MSSLELGSVLAGRFRLDRVLGQGGMGAVYEAFELAMGRRVAIKVIAPMYAGDQTFVARLRREALTSAGLHHPNIVQTTGLVELPPDPPFLVMEHVDGVSLLKVIEREGVLSLHRVARIGLQVLDALRLAHASGIVHRDLKPSNLLVTSTPAIEELVKLADFGIAKVLDEDRYTRLTSTGSMLGTPGYMAPEQALGGAVDGRTDLYTLGVVLFRLVAGHLPYHAKGAHELLIALVQHEPISLSQARPDLPDAFAAFFARALQKAPHLRFQSATEMADALAPFASTVETYASPGPAITRSSGAVQVAPTRAAPTHAAPKRTFYGLAAVVTIAALVCGVLLAVTLAARPTPTPTDAEIEPVSAPTAPIAALPPTVPIDAVVIADATSAVDASDVIDAAVDAATPAVVVDAATDAARPVADARSVTTRRRENEPLQRESEPVREVAAGTRRWTVREAGGSASSIVESAEERARRVLPAIQRCLDDDPPPNFEPTLVSVELSVARDGHISAISARTPEGPIYDRVFVRCISHQVEALRFHLLAGVDSGELTVTARVR